MDIRYENPPFINEVNEIFRLPEGVIFTFGDIIFNPSHAPIDGALMKHEELHSQQQGADPQRWWKRYLKDKDFRLSQEAAAYQIQYRELKKIVKDRNKLHTYLIILSKDLSGEMYGNAMTFQEAYEAITRQEIYNFDDYIVWKK